VVARDVEPGESISEDIESEVDAPDEDQYPVYEHLHGEYEHLDGEEFDDHCTDGGCDCHDDILDRPENGNCQVCVERGETGAAP